MEFDRKAIHTQMLKLILSKGERLPKKHGQWVQLKLQDGYFLQLDTWNKSVTLKKGTGDYEYYCGFSGENVIHVGSDWGGFHSNLTAHKWVKLNQIVFKENAYN